MCFLQCPSSENGLGHQQSSVLIHETIDTQTHRRRLALLFDIYMDLWGIDCHFPFFPMPRTLLLFSADTTCTTTHTNVVTFQALPSPLRVCGVSFVTVMSFSERCQCKKGTDKILHGDLQACPPVPLSLRPIQHACIHHRGGGERGRGGAMSQIYDN